MMEARFTVVGEALVDLVESATQPGTYTAHAGGSLYNVALTLARLGEDVSLVARSGQDAFGRMLEDKARASGVRFDRWQVVAEPTSLAVASMDADRKAHYDFYFDGTAGLGWDDSIVDLVPSGGVLHLGSLASWRPPSGPVLQALQKRAFDLGDTLVSYDPNIRPALIADVDAVRTSVERCVAAAHIVKTSDDDARFLYPGVGPEDTARRWCSSGALLVIVTYGADGAAAFAGGRELARCPGIEITLADTVGAGDSFSGGLLAYLADHGVVSPEALRTALADDRIVPDAVAQAVLVSALTCEAPGADPPTRAELDARRDSRG
jgi:fructokinase